MLEILDRLKIRIFYISGCKPHLINRFYDIELSLKSIYLSFLVIQLSIDEILVNGLFINDGNMCIWTGI